MNEWLKKLIKDLKEKAGDNTELVQYVENGLEAELKPHLLTAENVSEYIKSDDGYKNVFLPEYNRRLEKWKQEKLPSMLDEEVNKKIQELNPPKSEAEKRLAELEKKLAEQERQSRISSIRNKALKVAKVADQERQR